MCSTEANLEVVEALMFLAGSHSEIWGCLFYSVNKCPAHHRRPSLPAPPCSSLLLPAPPSSLLLPAPPCSSLLLPAPPCSSLLLLAPPCSHHLRVPPLALTRPGPAGRPHPPCTRDRLKTYITHFLKLDYRVKSPLSVNNQRFCL